MSGEPDATAGRSYTLSQQPLEFECGPVDEFELDRRWTETLQSHWPGLSGTWSKNGSRVVLPQLHELWFDGRTLRGEEYARAEELLQASAEAMGARTVHWWIEEMFVLDFHVMGRDRFQELSGIYPTLPGWLPGIAEGQLPQWFGGLEGPAPWLSASVEPPGLQVFGVLPWASWSEWKRQFLDATAALPYRTL